MCHKTQVLNQTKNGLLMTCSSCRLYHLTFGHFYLELTEKELHHFSAFLDNIDVEFWDDKHCICNMRRKIPIPTQQLNLYLMLNRTELEELKHLIYYLEKNKGMHFIKVQDVDYDFINN